MIEPEESKPLFKHDCESCKFLGTYQGIDLYYHPGSHGIDETVVARYSDWPSDYRSGLSFSRPYIDISGVQHSGIAVLVEARLRSEEAGFLKKR